MQTNILIKYPKTVICFCQRSLYFDYNITHKLFNLKKITSIWDNFDLKLSKLFLIETCIRNRLYSLDINKQQPVYIWLEINSPFLENFLQQAFKHSIIVRRLCNMKYNFNLNNPKDFKEYIEILITETLYFKDIHEISFNNISEEDYKNIISDYYKENNIAMPKTDLQQMQDKKNTENMKNKNNKDLDDTLDEI